MFTGIIECPGRVSKIEEQGKNLIFTVQSPVSAELKIDQSVAHDGVCLTVTGIDAASGTHRVTVIHETLEKSALREWKPGKLLNLERCLLMNGRLDGHIVQGHVDQVGVVDSIQSEDGSWRIRIRHEKGDHVTVEKGSICVNGVSLTVVDSAENAFSVAIIPYTYEHTNFRQLKAGDPVNLEFDIIGKYIARLMSRS